LAVDPTSTHEITTPALSGHPVGWILIFFSNGHIFRILSYGRDVRKGNKKSMKISVLSTHHPSTVVLSCVAGFIWLQPWDEELNEKLCPVQVSSIHFCAFAREGCLFTLHTGHSHKAGASDTTDSSTDDSPLSDASESRIWLIKKPTSLFTECYTVKIDLSWDAHEL
jgi:hypothetical protein